MVAPSRPYLPVFRQFAGAALRLKKHKSEALTMHCMKCKKSVGRLANYGSELNPLCFDCADSQLCDECCSTASISEQFVYNNKRLCRDCYSKIIVIEREDAKGDMSQDTQEEILNEHRSHNQLVSAVILIVIVVLGICWIPLSCAFSAISATGLGWRGSMDYGPVQNDFLHGLMVLIIPYLFLLGLSVFFFAMARRRR